MSHTVSSCGSEPGVRILGSPQLRLGWMRLHFGLVSELGSCKMCASDSCLRSTLSSNVLTALDSCCPTFTKFSFVFHDGQKTARIFPW